MLQLYVARRFVYVCVCVLCVYVGVIQGSSYLRIAIDEQREYPPVTSYVGDEVVSRGLLTS